VTHRHRRVRACARGPSRFGWRFCRGSGRAQWPRCEHSRCALSEYPWSTVEHRGVPRRASHSAVAQRNRPPRGREGEFGPVPRGPDHTSVRRSHAGGPVPRERATAAHASWTAASKRRQRRRARAAERAQYGAAGAFRLRGRSGSHLELRVGEMRTGVGGSAAPAATPSPNARRSGRGLRGRPQRRMRHARMRRCAHRASCARCTPRVVYQGARLPMRRAAPQRSTGAGERGGSRAHSCQAAPGARARDAAAPPREARRRSRRAAQARPHRRALRPCAPCPACRPCGGHAGMPRAAA
jgi:hypothetical protein